MLLLLTNLFYQSMPNTEDMEEVLCHMDSGAVVLLGDHIWEYLAVPYETGHNTAVAEALFSIWGTSR